MRAEDNSMIAEDNTLRADASVDRALRAETAAAVDQALLSVIARQEAFQKTALNNVAIAIRVLADCKNAKDALQNKVDGYRELFYRRDSQTLDCTGQDTSGAEECLTEKECAYALNVIYYMLGADEANAIKELTTATEKIAVAEHTLVLARAELRRAESVLVMAKRLGHTTLAVPQ